MKPYEKVPLQVVAWGSFLRLDELSDGSLSVSVSRGSCAIPNPGAVALILHN